MTSRMVPPTGFVAWTIHTLTAVAPIITITAASAMPPQARDEPATSQPTVEQRANVILDAALAKYRAAATYQDRFEMRFVMVAKDEDGDDAGMEQSEKGTFVFARPNRMAIVSDDFAVYCDGTQLTVHQRQLGQYMQDDAPGKLDLNRIAADGMPGVQAPHPVAYVMCQPDKPLSELFPTLGKITAVQRGERDGEPGTWVRAQAQVPMMEQAVAVAMWFSDRTRLLHELRLDMTEAYKRMNEDAAAYTDEEDAPRPPKVERVETVLTLRDIVLDDEIPAGRFAFKPGDGDEKVKEFSIPGMDASEQLELVGKPAPDFSGEDFDGKPLSLSDLRGRVVLMDFWATWCSPCVQAIPHVQKIAERLADRPVTVLGVNRDQAGSEKRVSKFLEKKKITFRQLKDFEGEVAEKYKVGGIPCTVLIDAKGVLQEIQTGFAPGGEDDLADKIERLLRGEDLFDPKELAERAESGEGGADSDVDKGASEATELAETAPERLVKLSSSSGSLGYTFRRADLDGDGRDELIAPDARRPGGVLIVSSDGSETQRIKLKGTDGAGVHALEPVKLEQDWYLLAGVVRMSGYSGNMSAASIGLYALNGEQRWRHDVKFPKKTQGQVFLAAGDLDANGSTEFVVALYVYEMRQRRANQWSSAEPRTYLLILGESGQPVCQKKVGQGVASLHVAPAAKPGEPATILFSDYQRLARYQFAPASGSLKPVRANTDAGPEGDSMSDPAGEPEVLCSSNLRGIGQACFIYAHGHEGRFPPDWQALIDENNSTVRQFHCPKSDAAVGDLNASYRYLPGQTTGDDPDNVVAIETGARHGPDGAFVLFADGRVEFIRPFARAEELAAKTQNKRKR